MIIFMARELLNTTGKRIRVLRDEAGITQKDLGDAVGIRQAYMSQIEKDKSMPPADLLAQIARVLHTSADYLLLLTDDADRGATLVAGVGISEEAEETARLIDGLNSAAQRRYCLDMVRLFSGYNPNFANEWAGELNEIGRLLGPEAVHLIVQYVRDGRSLPDPAVFLELLAVNKLLKPLAPGE